VILGIVSLLRRRMLLLGACGFATLLVAGGAVGLRMLRSTPSAGRARAAKLATVAPSPAGAGGSRAGRLMPRPVPLTGGWRFLADPGNVGLREDWAHAGAKLRWTPVAVPNDFNPVVSSRSFRGSIGWYEVSFTGPAISRARSWEVYFEEVRRHAEVWLNGRMIGTNSDPYAPFSLPASSLRAGARNLLVVRVDNVITPRSFFQDWWNWGGIVRPVELAPVGRISLADLGVMPELGCHDHCGGWLIEGTLINHARVPLNPVISVTSSSPYGVVTTSTHRVRSIVPGGSLAVSFRVRVAGRPDLWSPAHPALYQVRVETIAQRRVEQLNTLRTGLRRVQVRNGILYLNGRRVWLHGAAIHEDIQGRGAALTLADINTIVSELRSVGANITRAHYLLSERLLDALDAAGIMVWSQPPIDQADRELASPTGRAQALTMVRATLLGDRSHPSVIVHSVGNELTPTPDATPGTRSYLEQAINLTRRLDPPALVADDVFAYPYPAQRVYAKLDLLGLSDYWGWYRGPPGHSIANFHGLRRFLTQTHSKYPHQALLISEFGAEGLFNGPATTKGTYEFQDNYLRKTFAVIDRLPFINGAIYWTLREFAVQPGWRGGAKLPHGHGPSGLNHKGLIAYDGTEKPAFAAAMQLFKQVPSFAR
jgi:Glycosyl hydrolases family 2, TIM barrel domain/Glycosyl hydrolases family 2, sugar binding domain/Glycosyl hydrolases family 2